MNTDRNIVRNVAFFGGSFDPPHAGHVAVVKWLLEQGDIDAVLVVPCFAHAFDKRMTAFEHRMRMCRLAFLPLGERVIVSDIESTLPRPSFTVDTVHAIIAQNPGWHMRLVIGSDIPAEASKWKDFDKLRELAPPVCVNRGGLVNQPDAPVFPRISSTNVRRRLATDIDPGDLVPPGIAEFIRDEGLYRSGDIETSIVICGCGRVGTSLALTFIEHGMSVTAIDSAEVIQSRTNLPERVTLCTGIADAVPAGRAVWFICVGDRVVADAVADIQAIADPELDSVVVTSATASIDGDWPVSIGRAHPLRAFPPAEHAFSLPANCHFAIQSAPRPVVDALDAIDAASFVLAPDHMATYHAAAVLASNLPGALAWKAAAMFKSCGLPDPQGAALDLMRSMLDNLFTSGFSGISGPAARGDKAAVATDQAATDAFDQDAGMVHRILTDMITRDIFGYANMDMEPGEK